MPHEHPGTLSDALARRKLKVRTVDVWKAGARFPDPRSAGGLVIMGGPMGVYEQDRYPFLKTELAFIRRFLKTGRPVLGICLGSQLIAAALGARVFPNKYKEVGWYPVRLTPAGRRDPLLGAWGRGAEVFQWHGDTFTRPRGAALLARAPLCRHQAIRYRDDVYGLQFHPEVTAAMVREWLRQPGARAEVAAARAAHPPADGLSRRAGALAARARAVLDGWAGLIASR